MPKLTAPLIRPALSTLLVLLAGLLWTVAPAQPAFDPDIAQSELDRIESLLREDASIEQLGDAQRRIDRIRTEAIRCVRNSDILTGQLEAERELLGPGSDNDPAEIIEQRTTFDVEIKRSEARAGACRLLILHTEQVSGQAAALQAELNTRRLTQPDIDGPSALARVLRDPGAAWRAAWDTVFKDARLNDVTPGRWFLAIAGALLAAGLGWLARKSLLDWCDRQRGRAGKPTVPVTLVRRFSENAPWLLGGATAAIALGLYATAPRGEIVLFRLAFALLFYGLGRAVINWIVGSFSPGTGLFTKESHTLHARTRLHALLLAVILGWLALGPGWLTRVPVEGQFAARALLVVYLVAALLWVLRLGRVVPALRARLAFLKLALGLAALGAAGAELAGYRNLANYLLSSVLITMAAGFALWTVTWGIRQALQGVISGTSTISYRVRSWMGIRQDERSAELGWLSIVTNIALWVAFGSFLLSVWDPTGTATAWLRNLTLEGIEFGDTVIVPRNIVAGVAAFGVLIALTAWLKARLNRRWLRDTGIDRHAREALVTVTGYSGFAVAVLSGLTLAGVSMATLAIVFGALGVGIGFGLQNIVNNFVSGLILLFERPIKAGDFVTVGMIEGTVKEVRTRATEIETLDRQNVLVPNSELISNQVTNWVLRDPHGRLVLDIGVAYGSDTALVIELLEQIATGHPEVVTTGRTPAPRALFMAFGDSALEFELRCWIRNIERRFHVVSDLNLAIDAAFRENGIVVPFPQRDLHIIPPSSPQPPASPPEPDPAPGDDDQPGGDSRSSPPR